MSTKTPTPAKRREVRLAKPLIQGGKRFKPDGDEKPRLTERQIERLTQSGHIASTPATGGKAAAKSEG
ncbi:MULTISPECIES: hypothetical protein [Halomonas]|uniref:Uncharacterized protein n=1 Tax=Halomonas halophila TaxID=29573 RepID=A0ABQ0TZX8_9GAMM|nr:MULTISPECIES: hypothetical protein [Halomonas]MDR5889634.1 hypothetical protein [Halomonas salina]WJY06316.1 hypothetical protein QWG60_11420 [Halomonas halophila]GEK71597.1 hypothetical protein HHA04nite_01410 [Halomonas halophila]